MRFSFRVWFGMLKESALCGECEFYREILAENTITPLAVAEEQAKYNH